MEYRTACTLYILLLLQLCRTEISNTLPESWYSANVINDDNFSPKPLVEIFSTEATFSSTNPIVVWPSSSLSPNDPVSTSPRSTTVIQSSTTSTNSPISTSVPTTVLLQSSNGPISTSIPTTLSPQSSSAVTNKSVPTSTSTPTSQQPTVPNPVTISRITVPTSAVALTTTSSTLLDTQSQTVQQQTTTPLQLIEPRRQPILPQIPPAPQPQSIQPEPQTQSQPNYFVFYQQAPQSIQTYPSGPLPSGGSVIAGPGAIPVFQPAPVSAISNETPTSIPTTFTSTFRSPIAKNETIPIPQLVPQSIPISKLVPQSIAIPKLVPQSIPIPKLVPQSSGQLPVIRIRMMSPSGSITNVNINPTTSTAKPMTTRTKKMKRARNNYDGCVKACKGGRNPICASPVAVSPLDPNTLKGFPSICHMACHNSFRKNTYQKVMDGRCGRLRNRIRTIDSKDKLKREELDKAQYTIVQDVPQTVVEFSPVI